MSGRHAADAQLLDVIEKLPVPEPVLPDSVQIPATGTDFGLEVPGSEPEPTYAREKRQVIQGNILPGFNKDHQHFLFLRIGAVKPAKRWLHWIAPRISSMDEVIAFVRAHRSLRLRLGVKEPGLTATWVNIAFSCPGLGKLLGKGACAPFGERSFRQGLAVRSSYLGDPTRRSSRGNCAKWVFGAPKKEADIVVIVAADRPDDVERMAAEIKERAKKFGLELLFEQRGDTLPGRLRGHEHFGFKDGVSQPGVRGKLSPAAGDFITPRYFDAMDPRARLFAKPGQPLLWPGQFLLGEPRQNPQDLFASAPAATNFPAWARLGSYLVVRRLRQDVPAFWQFAREAAEQLGMPATRFASMLVGRWPSGAPLMRARARDDAALAGDEFANNHFLFDDRTRASSLRPVPGYAGDPCPETEPDVLGTVCPHFAHIRKANPRDSATDLGKPADSLIRMILRRGIPFGAPIVGVKRPAPRLVKQERGLMFLCYGSTVEDQFEFLTRRWANSPIRPNFGGHDPIIGQRDQYGSRTRHIDFPGPAGTVRLELKRDFVTPTGGGYFFAPPIDAITAVLGA